MSRHPQPRGERGSLRWIQEFVNDRPGVLDSAIVSASGQRIKGPIQWRSPLADDDYAEYRDDAFLEKLGIELEARPLAEFWPRRGPQWDALALDASGACVLVEAKAHIPEIISSPTAASPESKALIDRSLREVAAHLNAETSTDLSGTFYQYANRLAHLYLLHEVNGVDAWLVFVYFVGDGDVRRSRQRGGVEGRDPGAPRSSWTQEPSPPEPRRERVSPCGEPNGGSKQTHMNTKLVEGWLGIWFLRPCSKSERRPHRARMQLPGKG